MADSPIIAYNNLLRGTGYTVLLGTDEIAAPLSNAWTWDMSQLALPTADTNGTLSFSVTLSSGVGYGVDATGAFVPYGGILPYGGVPAADTMILGAARNNPSGLRFSGGHLQVLADGVEVFAQQIYAPDNASTLYKLTAHSAPAVYTITVTNLTPNATVRIPELFIGPALNMPGLELGHDAYPETYAQTSFKSATGREIRSRYYVRAEQPLNWRFIEPSKANEVKLFVEEALELLQPFWFCAFPDSAPATTYMGIHAGTSAPMPYTYGMVVASFSIKFQEKL